jgi:surface polysaccharide O-acyltransferase-like enzyme
LLFGLPVAVVEAGLVTSTMGGEWNEYAYAILLLCGFLIAADSRFGQAMGRGWRSALVTGLVIQVVYVVEAFLPVYILHQTVVFVIGYYVVQWEMAALLKYFVISLSSLAATLLLYEFAVRRTQVTRWLFGMRPRQDRAA